MSSTKSFLKFASYNFVIFLIFAALFFGVDNSQFEYFKKHLERAKFGDYVELLLFVTVPFIILPTLVSVFFSLPYKKTESSFFGVALELNMVRTLGWLIGITPMIFYLSSGLYYLAFVKDILDESKIKEYEKLFETVFLGLVAFPIVAIIITNTMGRWYEQLSVRKTEVETSKKDLLETAKSFGFNEGKIETINYQKIHLRYAYFLKFLDKGILSFFKSKNDLETNHNRLFDKLRNYEKSKSEFSSLQTTIKITNIIGRACIVLTLIWLVISSVQFYLREQEKQVFIKDGQALINQYFSSLDVAKKDDLEKLAHWRRTDKEQFHRTVKEVRLLSSHFEKDESKSLASHSSSFVFKVTYEIINPYIDYRDKFECSHGLYLCSQNIIPKEKEGEEPSLTFSDGNCQCLGKNAYTSNRRELGRKKVTHSYARKFLVDECLKNGGDAFVGSDDQIVYQLAGLSIHHMSSLNDECPCIADRLLTKWKVLSEHIFMNEGFGKEYNWQHLTFIGIGNSKVHVIKTGVRGEETTYWNKYYKGCEDGFYWAYD